MTVLVVTPDHPLRSQVEALVSAAYARAYGAWVRRFPRRMLAVLDARGRPACAAGLRDAGDGFFSEYYLNEPIERILAARARRDVKRETVLELVSFAAERPAYLLPLLRGVARTAATQAYGWGLFTATHRLRSFAEALGLPLLDLAEARRDRAPELELWGRYYDTAPRVMAVEAGLAARCLMPMRRATLLAAV